MAEYLAIPLGIAALFVLWIIWMRKMAPALAGVKNISLAEYRDMFKKQSHLLLDVRTPGEFASGHAPRARSLPLDDLARLGSDECAKMANGKPVVCICATGNRSAMAATALAKAGVETVYNLTGGMAAWSGAGLTIRRSNA